ncbi:MAG: hypothetical protein PHP26_02810 [Syntrophomonas sp.]|uniref:hypothetical protein n=1 Tax=Syntrophomonas sp. TaxID=2053627 RepID=UPI0026352908|nr:hypothetical protein [Syntrophomonas sp.]MDD2511006.1 hypothetical protein [Syntrophomonas sp.]MDD3878906.1 hypothetical protein [Syntrophomonas sp.]MDD4626879.1 hypothetical protein [Syntrophomonas sp.]
MKELEINLDFFQDKLESFLQQLFQEINTVSGAQAWKEGEPEKMENHLYELNSFYYRSFNEHFFPAYRSELKEELASLLKLKRQQDAIKRDIMANLQRYARLYNQVKSLDFSLQQAQENCLLALESIDEKEKERGIELYYRLQKAGDAISYVNELLYQIKQLEQDKEALAALNRESSSIILIYILKLDRDNPEELDYYYQWMKSIHYWNNALLDLLENQESLPRKAARFITKFSKEYRELKEQALPSFSFMEPYPAYWHTQQLEFFDLYLISLKNSEILRFVKALQLFLSDTLLFMTKALASEGENKNIGAGASAMMDYCHIKALNLNLKELEENISKSWQSLNHLIKEFPARGEMDMAYFLERSQEIISDSYPAISTAKSSLGSHQNTALASALYRARLELSSLKDHIELLKEKQHYGKAIQQSYLQLAALLSQHKEWMANFRSDLERLLAPRNLSRSWKDLSLRVEKINLQKGQEFPQEFLYLLDKYQIASRVSPERPNLILEEEGDIFIFKVDDLQEELIPFFVVSAGPVDSVSE